MFKNILKSATSKLDQVKNTGKDSLDAGFSKVEIFIKENSEIIQKTWKKKDYPKILQIKIK